MANYRNSAKGSYGSVLVELGPSEGFVSEAGAMFRASSNVDIDVTTRSRGAGGLMSGIKRLIAGESFFFSTYKTIDGRRGEVGLAPTLAGEVAVIECSGRNRLAVRRRQLPRLDRKPRPGHAVPGIEGCVLR